MRVYCIISIFLFFVQSPAAGGSFILEEKLSGFNLGYYIEYYVDKNKALNINEILLLCSKDKLKWEKPETETLGFGYKDKAYWVRLQVKNPLNKNIDWLIQQRYSSLGFIDFYAPKDKEGLLSYKTGQLLKFKSRPVKHRTFVFPVTTKAQKTATYYLRYESPGNIIISLSAYTPREFQKMKDAELPMLWISYGILFIMFFYNLFIFIFSRDISYLYYILYLLGFTILVLVLNGTGFQYFWPESSWWAFKCVPFLIGISTFVFIQFARNFIRREKFKNLIKIDRVVAFISYLMLIAGFAYLFFNKFTLGILFTVPLLGLTIVFACPLIIYLAVIEKSREARIFGIAFIPFFAGILLYILKTFGFITENFITNYSMQIGADIQALLLSFGLVDRMNIMKIKIERQEKKYRHLAESSGEIIFSLDSRLNFLNINSSVKNILGYHSDELLNMNFFELIFESRREDSQIAIRIIKDYIRDLRETMDKVTFRTKFKIKASHEYKELQVNLEYMETEKGGHYFMGNASPVIDDALVNFIDAEQSVYKIGNYLNNADIVINRITGNLTRYLTKETVDELQIALREVLVNAIEHGNLNISYEDKTEKLKDERYVQFIMERQRDPRYRDHTVNIESSFNENEVKYTITDSGEGFDHKIFMNNATKRVNLELHSHGRGLAIIKAMFDMVIFNEKGNQVTLIKYVH